MTESEVILVMRQHLEGKFPKNCGMCGRSFANLKDYLLHTTHVGPPLSYDAELGDFRPSPPIGTMSLANCRCGNTLSLDSRGMSLMTLWRLLRWLRGEMTRRRQKAPEVLEDLRRAIDRAAAIRVPLGLDQIEHLFDGMVVDGIQPVIPKTIGHRGSSLLRRNTGKMGEADGRQTTGQEYAFTIRFGPASHIPEVNQIPEGLFECCSDLPYV